LNLYNASGIFTPNKLSGAAEHRLTGKSRLKGDQVMKNLSIAVMTLTMSLTLFANELNKEEEKLQNFITKHVETIKPLEKQTNLAYWDASNSGKSEDYDKLSKLQLTIRRIYSNPNDFALLKELKQSGQVKDPKLARQLVVLYNAYLRNQIGPDLLKEIVDLSTKIEKKFNTFRGTIDGKEVTLIGTAHVSTASAELVEKVIEDGRLSSLFQGYSFHCFLACHETFPYEAAVLNGLLSEAIFLELEILLDGKEGAIKVALMDIWRVSPVQFLG